MKPWIAKLFMSKNLYDHYWCYDIALFLFNRKTTIVIKDLGDNIPSNGIEIFNQLADDGMVVIINGIIHITASGRAKLFKGGYVRTFVAERISHYCIIIAAITGIITIILMIY